MDIERNQWWNKGDMERGTEVRELAEILER